TSASSPRRYLPSFPTRRSSDLLDQLPLHPPVAAEVGERCTERDPVQTRVEQRAQVGAHVRRGRTRDPLARDLPGHADREPVRDRSEEHTSELQSRENLVCRLLL